MFDLFRSRAKAVRYLLGGMLTIVAVSMVITLIPGWGSSTGSSNEDNIVAVVGKDEITVRDVQNELQALIRNKQIPAEMMQVYAPQYIDQMITERAVAYEARRRGFTIPDSELASTIRSVLPRFFNNGQLIDKAAYQQFLEQQGLTIPEFEANLRKQLLLKRLTDLALEGVIVTPQEAEQEYKTQNEKLKVELISFKPDDLKSLVKVTPEELRAYYNSNKEGFTEPETRDLILLIADQNKIAATIEIPEPQLRAAYNARRAEFQTPERVQVRHILLKTTDKSPAEVEKIRAKAEDILKQLKNGANFAELAKKYSEDPGSAQKGGDLGWVVRGQTVKNFENTAFSLKPKELSGVITTEYGFHILQVLDKQEAHTQSFEEVKDQIAADLKKQAVFDRMQTAIEQARAALVKNPADAQGIAKQFNLEYVVANGLASGQPVPQLGSVAELDTALAGMKKGEITPVFQAGADKLAIAELTNVTPSHIAPFEKAEANIREKFVSQRAMALAADRARQAAEKLRAGEDINKVAKELGGEVKSPPEFTLSGAVEGVGSASVFSEGFSKPVGSILGPLNVFNQQVVAKTLEKTPADMTKFAADRDKIIEDLKRKKAQERRDLFYDSILAKLIKEGKVKKHNDAIKRLVASYRNS
jgi:peptidyl-prolyl cis-trans isomerase D